MLGDKRLTARLVHGAELLAGNPGEPVSATLRAGGTASVSGYDRLIGQPDDGGVTVDSILAPHRGRTIERMRGERTVPCIQRGSDLR